MDNLTHTLVGVTVAHSLPKKFRTPAVYWASVIGNNLPDSDFIFSRLPNTTSLDYLVHHRGYTHSFFMSFALAVMGAWLATLIGNPKGKRQLTFSIYFFTLLGCFTHIGADFLNSYGVHPFSPFNNHWFYGDTLFIIEPWIWMILIPGAFVLARRLTAKVFWLVVLAFGIGLVWKTDYLPITLKILTTAMSFVSLFIHTKRQTISFSVLSLIVIVSGFSYVSSVVKTEVQKAMHDRASDIEATPAPGNPYCWSSWVRVNRGDTISEKSAIIAPFPKVFSLEKCSELKDARPRHGSPTRLATHDDTDTTRWQYEVLLSEKEFKNVYNHSCAFQKLMSFVRFPYFVKEADGSWLAGDLRFDTRDKGDFTQYRFQLDEREVTCSQSNSPWDSPFLSKN